MNARLIGAVLNNLDDDKSMAPLNFSVSFVRQSREERARRLKVPPARWDRDSGVH
jgi:hypothetical protein